MGPGVDASASVLRSTQTTPLKDHPLATHRKPSALYCWILEIFCCTPRGCRALLRIPSTERRRVCLCWAPSKPKGPGGNITPLSCFIHHLGYPWFELFGTPPFDTTISLVEASGLSIKNLSLLPKRPPCPPPRVAIQVSLEIKDTHRP